MARSSTGLMFPTHRAKASKRRRMRKYRTRFTSTRTETN